MFQASKRAMELEYAIRDVVLPAREIERKGNKVIHLNIGDPNQFDFDTPQYMRDALLEATNDGYNKYAPSEGDIELRKAILEREKKKNGIDVDIENVLVTSGVSESIMFLFGATLSPGDNILIEGPSYPPYTAYSKFFGAEPISYSTIEDEGWIPDPDDIRKKVNQRTKAIVVINPNNPTGSLYPKKILKEICDIAGENRLFLISDEIYDEITYEKPHRSPASLNKDIPMVIFNGFSKVYMVPGWRIGYSIFRDPRGELEDIKEGFNRQARARLSANSPCQHAAIAGLNGDKKYLKEMMSKLKQRRDFAYKRLNEIEGISTAKPGGAFYIFPKIGEENDKKFVLDFLKEHHVLFVHGSGFDPIYGAGHIRSVFLAPVPVLEEAFNRLEKFIKTRK